MSICLLHPPQKTGRSYHLNIPGYMFVYMYVRFLYIKPCLLAHGCGIWVYPLVVLIVVYKLKCKNIAYGTTLSLNWYGNASLEYLLTTFFPPSIFTWGMVVWTLLVRSTFHYDAWILWTMVIAPNLEVFVHFTLVSMQFLGIRKEIKPWWEILSSIITYYIWKVRCLSFSSR